MRVRDRYLTLVSVFKYCLRTRVQVSGWGSDGRLLRVRVRPSSFGHEVLSADAIFSQ